MIAEFALTPSVFDETAHADKDAWLDQLNELKAGMFPRTAPSAVLISDLADGAWTSMAELKVKAVTDHRMRLKVQALFTHIKAQLVRRKRMAPTGDITKEAWWAREAIRSADQVEGIDQIIGSVDCPGLVPEHPGRISPIHNVTAEVFWSNVASVWAPLVDTAGQVNSVRKILAHAEFVWLVSPYVRGLAADETPFACELLRRLFSRRPGSQLRQVQVHIEGPDRTSRHASEYPRLLANIRANAAYELERSIPRGQSVQLVIWEKLLERVLLAGDYITRSSGESQKPRWCVHMGHVARAADRTATERHDWNLVSDDRRGALYTRYENTAAPNFVTSLEVHGIR